MPENILLLMVNKIYFSGRNITAVILDAKNQPETLWTIDIPATNDLIKAGNYLYAADSTGISAIRINRDNKPELVWKHASGKLIERLIASNGKLIAVLEDGSIQVFGDKPVASVSYLRRPDVRLIGNSALAKKITGSTGTTEGFALVFGTDDIRLLEGLVAQTSLSIIAYEKDPERIDYLREYFDGLGIQADRLSFLPYDKTHPLLPKYFSSLTIINDIDFLNGFDKEVA